LFLWGAEQHATDAALAGLAFLAFLGVFSALVVVFLCAGSAVGAYFPTLPPLRAYAADLGGSLAGVIAFTLATLLGAGPPIWLLLAALPLALLSRRRLSWAALAVVVAAGAWSVQGALFSPYNRIDIARSGPSTKLPVNRDFHQYMHDLSDAALSSDGAPPADGEQPLRFYRSVYDLPFVLNDARERALIVGAGTGNDVMAALRQGYASVYSVDI